MSTEREMRKLPDETMVAAIGYERESCWVVAKSFSGRKREISKLK